MTELPQEEIEITAAATPAPNPSTMRVQDMTNADDETQADPRLLAISLALVAVVAAAAVIWALLV